MNPLLSLARLLSLVLPLVALSAHAGAVDAPLADAKKMTRCAWMLISSGAKVKESSPVHKVSVEIASVMLIDRSRQLGASRPMQEFWMTELARQAAAPTLVERLQLFVEWSRCRSLVKAEAARKVKTAETLESSPRGGF